MASESHGTACQSLIPSPSRSWPAFREQQRQRLQNRRRALDPMQWAGTCRHMARRVQPRRPCFELSSCPLKSSARGGSYLPPSLPPSPLCPRPPAGRAPRPVVCARQARAPLHPFEAPAPSQIPGVPCRFAGGAGEEWRGTQQTGMRAPHLILRISSGGGRRGRLAGFEPSVRHCPVPSDIAARPRSGLKQSRS
jgi:hypothetical protein